MSVNFLLEYAVREDLRILSGRGFDEPEASHRIHTASFLLRFLKHVVTINRDIRLKIESAEDSIRSRGTL